MNYYDKYLKYKNKYIQLKLYYFNIEQFNLSLITEKINYKYMYTSKNICNIYRENNNDCYGYIFGISGRKYYI